MSDLISRQAAIDVLLQHPFEKVVNCISILEELPSAQPSVKDINVRSSDCISRQVAIDDLHGKDPSQIWDTADIEVCVNALPSAQAEQRWIPCSERLPEQYGNYLVSYRTDDFESDIGTFDPDRINSDTGEWSACDANGFYWVASKGLEVIAWMPLPEPYEERREE